MNTFNTIEIVSDAMVQHYVLDDGASVYLTNDQLFRIQQVLKDSKNAKNITFTLEHKMFQMVNNIGKRDLKPKEFKALIGGSSAMKPSFKLRRPQMSTAIITLN